jgi:hypothetical protein
VRDLHVAPPQDPGNADWYLTRWAEEAGISLVNLFEFIAALGDSPLRPLIQSELAKQTPHGYAAASDVARVFLYRLGGLYTDPDNEILGLERLWEIGSGQTQDTFAIAVRDGGITNSFLALTRNHPIAYLEERKLLENYRLNQPLLLSRFERHHDLEQRHDLEDHDLARYSVLYRSGPAVLDRLIRSVGYTYDSAPAFDDIVINSDVSWTASRERQRIPRRWARQDTLIFTQSVIQTMIRSLYNREGDLHLTRINEAVQTHPNPALIWDAAFAFLSESDDLRPRLSSVTYSDAREPDETRRGPWEQIGNLLPPAAFRLLQRSHQPVSLGAGQTWLGERPVAARLLDP